MSIPADPSTTVTPRVTRRSLVQTAILLAISGAASAWAPTRLNARESQETDTLPVTELAPGIFVHAGTHALASAANLGGISNAAFIIGEECVAVIDTGGSYRFGVALREAIRARTDRPIRYVINTHMHPDHVLGNAAFRGDQPAFVAHSKMGRGLAARSGSYLSAARTLLGEEAFAGTVLVLPTQAIETSRTIDLGQRTLRLDPQPTAHTDNDLVIFDDRTRTLFTGDLLFVDHVPALDGSILGWLEVIARLRVFAAERAVPGHGPASVSWPDALDPQERYLQAIVRDVRAMIEEGQTLKQAMSTAAIGEKGGWEMFEDYHARNVASAFAELEWE